MTFYIVHDKKVSSVHTYVTLEGAMAFIKRTKLKRTYFPDRYEFYRIESPEKLKSLDQRGENSNV